MLTKKWGFFAVQKILTIFQQKILQQSILWVLLDLRNPWPKIFLSKICFEQPGPDVHLIVPSECNITIPTASVHTPGYYDISSFEYSNWCSRPSGYKWEEDVTEELLWVSGHYSNKRCAGYPKKSRWDQNLMSNEPILHDQYIFERIKSHRWRFLRWKLWDTVMMWSIGTDRSEQTVQNQIRLFHKEQSDQGRLCLLFVCIFWTQYCTVKSNYSSCRTITVIILGVPIFRIFTVVSVNLPWKHEGWLVGCFGFNGPLRQYFSLYRAVSQREGERGEKG